MLAMDARKCQAWWAVDYTDQDQVRANQATWLDGVAAGVQQAA